MLGIPPIIECARRLFTRFLRLVYPRCTKRNYYNNWPVLRTRMRGRNRYHNNVTASLGISSLFLFDGCQDFFGMGQHAQMLTSTIEQHRLELQQAAAHQAQLDETYAQVDVDSSIIMRQGSDVQPVFLCDASIRNLQQQNTDLRQQLKDRRVETDGSSTVNTPKTVFTRQCCTLIISWGFAAGNWGSRCGSR